MTSRENANTNQPRHLLVPQPIGTLNSAVLDLLNYESASFLVDIGAANLGAAVGVTLTVQESVSDAIGGPFTTVDPLYLEWFQEGNPGSPVSAAGSQVWTQSIPGYGGVLTLNTEVNITNKVYTASYVGGQHRYIRLAIAPVGAPTNLIAVLGLLGAPRETSGKIFSNWVS